MPKPILGVIARSNQNEELRARLEEAEETLRAIRSGEVDALVISGVGGQKIFTLKETEEVPSQRLVELEALQTVSRALRMAQSLGEALSILLDQTLVALETDAGIIWLYDPESDELRAAVVRGWLRRVSHPAMRPGEGISGTVFASGQTYLSEDVAVDPLARAISRQRVPLGWSGACVPIYSGAVTVGVLLISVKSPRKITTEQVRLLESLAEMAGMALHRMNLYEETMSQLARLQALRAIDKTISGNVNLQTTLNVILEQATAQLHVDAAAISLLNPNTPTLEYAAERGFHTQAVRNKRLRLGESYAGRVALDRQLIQISNLKDKPHTLLTAEDFVCYYGLPLISKEKVKGVLEVFHRATLEPNAEWFDFLNTLAGQAAIAIENAALFDSLQHSNLELSMAYDATIEGWSRALDLRGKETEGHSKRVMDMTLHLAQIMGIGNQALEQVRWGALLHDIGKMSVPDKILFKPGPLTEEEWVAIKRHPTFAYEMLSPIRYLKLALDIPYCHHEKWDGSGYPRGLKGTQIPLVARIFSVVDVWDALCSDRTYRVGWEKEKVREHILASSGTHFDPQSVDAFMQFSKMAN